MLHYVPKFQFCLFCAARLWKVTPLISIRGMNRIRSRPENVTFNQNSLVKRSANRSALARTRRKKIKDRQNDLPDRRVQKLVCRNVQRSNKRKHENYPFCVCANRLCAALLRSTSRFHRVGPELCWVCLFFPFQLFQQSSQFRADNKSFESTRQMMLRLEFLTR